MADGEWQIANTPADPVLRLGVMRAWPCQKWDSGDCAIPEFVDFAIGYLSSAIRHPGMQIAAVNES
ncbi:MAG TPA: hypothetical protein VIB79_16015 [Candidatus Binatia bacterium]|jgi:hypothetical protein